ncbi:MAG: response regulator [Candidatus Omnitrophica bacterium]|jgi:CheY-like chemotaxis protein|nr:response regulator [Candidatus Omnitrophota bacterium]
MAKKILIVDDDVEVLELMRKELEAQRYDVVVAFDGEDGFMKAKTQVPNLIIMDVILPKINGYQLAAKLKKDHETKDIPIIVASEYGSMMELFEEGQINDSFRKPFLPGIVAGKARKFLGEIRGKKVLIIDDEADLLKVLEVRFRANRYAVVTATNGQEGLEKVKSESPDLIILDFMMPVMNGYEFFKIIKSDPYASSIPVIVLTARGPLKDSFEMAGADAFMPKPFDAGELVDLAKELLLPKALVLCDADGLAKKIGQDIWDRGCKAVLVKTEKEMFENLALSKYKFIVVYVPSVVNYEPAQFIALIKKDKNKDTPVIIYSNSKTPGTETGNIVVLREISNKWLEAKADNFFDLRVAEEDFPGMVEKCLGQIPTLL